MKKILFRSNKDLTIEDIEDFIQQHEMEERPRLRKLYEYYIGEHDILRRQYEPKKPDTRMVHNFPNFITNQATAYFLGTPISYTSEDDEVLLKIKEILEFNDEADTNATHAEYMSIYGKSYELLYIDKSEEGQEKKRVDTRFTAVNPEEMFLIYDYSLDPNIIAAVRYFYDENRNLQVELYGKDTVTYLSGDSHSLKEDEIVEHLFGDVPASVFHNNNTLQGDFEPVISLIDEYNELNSDTANDFNYFSDAYLFLSGALLDDDEATNMRERRIINVEDPTADAKFLIKDIQNAALEDFKNRIVNDIHKFSAIPNLTDEQFSNNTSGVAIKYKILGLENLASMKERKFKKGLQRRFELMFNLLYARGAIAHNNYLSIIPTFKRSLPSNLLEEAQITNLLYGIVSKETLLDHLSFIEDATIELQQIEDEMNESFIDKAYEAKVIEEEI